MDFKSLKQDLTYCCKKFVKEGKILSAFGDNLTINDEFKFVSEGQYLDPLEMLVLTKGFVPTMEQSTVYSSQHLDPQTSVLTISNVPHWTGHNLSMLDVLAEQASLDRGDLCNFLDGFENVLGCGNEKSDFYTLGVYIREKFSPFGVRTEPLKSNTNYVYRIQDGKTPERMFAIYTRKNETSIVEAECYVLDSTAELPAHEFKALVTAPEILFEKRKKDGAIVPAVFYSHSLYRNYNDALAATMKLIEQEFAFKLRKYGTTYTNVDVASACMCIKLIKLPGSTFKTDAEKAIELMELSKTLSAVEMAQKMRESGIANWGVDDPELAPVWKELEAKSKLEES